MTIDVSIISVSVTPPEKLPHNWEFDFTRGYAAWMLSWHPELQQCPIIPWEVVLDIRYNSGNSFIQFKQIGTVNRELFEHASGLRLVLWTKTQSLNIKDSSGSQVMTKFPWEKPLTYYCVLCALIEPGYYDEEQMDFLYSHFSPDWAKGNILDDQSLIDIYSPTDRIYCGYWKYFMNRCCNVMKQHDLLLFCNPRITEQTHFSIEGHVSSRNRSQLEERMPLFFSSELQIGIYSKVPKAVVDEFHKGLPSRIREWIERRKA